MFILTFYCRFVSHWLCVVSLVVKFLFVLSPFSSNFVYLSSLLLYILNLCPESRYCHSFWLYICHFYHRFVFFSVIFYSFIYCISPPSSLLTFLSFTFSFLWVSCHSSHHCLFHLAFIHSLSPVTHSFFYTFIHHWFVESHNRHVWRRPTLFPFYRFPHIGSSGNIRLFRHPSSPSLILALSPSLSRQQL